MVSDHPDCAAIGGEADLGLEGKHFGCDDGSEGIEKQGEHGVAPIVAVDRLRLGRSPKPEPTKKPPVARGPGDSVYGLASARVLRLSRAVKPQPIAGAVSATGVAVAAARSSGKL